MLFNAVSILTRHFRTQRYRNDFLLEKFCLFIQRLKYLSRKYLFAIFRFVISYYLFHNYYYSYR